ncbi:MAG: aldehyde dehydrogenase family protein [Pseudomonadota bacterium]
MAVIDLPQSITEFLGKQHEVLIGSDWRQASGGDPIAVINPADGAQISAIGESSKNDVDSAVTAARAAFEDGPWGAMKPDARAKLIYRIADHFEAHAEELAILETLDNGKPISAARGEVISAINAMRYYAGWADKITGSTHTISMPGDHHVYTMKEPVGVAGLIIPWNYPIVMACMKLGPALAAGCTAVLKPAEDTSLTALRLGSLMLEAGLPEGVVNIVTGYGATVGAAIASHPGIDKIAFTGSTMTGKAIAKMAAEDLRKVSLELGGKSPNLIMEDANLEKAIPMSAMGICYNAGQTCTAPSRLYVQESIADQVIEGVAQFGSALKLGPGLDDETQIGPLVSQKQFDRVTGYIETGKAEGAEIASGGRRVGNQGFFLEPTVIKQTRNDMTIVREEIFGPVLVVQTFKDADEAVTLANDNDYGLAAAIWTENVGTAHKMARRIKAGNIGVNTTMTADWDVPLGGFKQSGIGHENGIEGLNLYLQTKAVFTTL